MNNYKWKLTVQKGGHGSGNRGHRGRPGQRGGSMPGGGGGLFLSGISQDVSDKIQEYQNEILTKTGYQFNDVKTFSGGTENDSVVACGGGLPQNLELNSDIWQSKETFREYMAGVSEEYFYSKNPKSFIVHEAGHGLAFKNPGDIPRLQKIYEGWRLPSDGRVLSEYSMSNYREMTAEAFTAFYFGDTRALKNAGLEDTISIFEGWIK